MNDRGQQPAFPPANESYNSCWQGLTVREWYAGLALQGLISAHAADAFMPADAWAAKESFAYADAMLAESAKTS